MTGKVLQKASKVWSGRGNRLDLLGSERAQQKGEGQEFDMVPNPMAVCAGSLAVHPWKQRMILMMGWLGF